MELNPTAENRSMPSSGVAKWEITDFVLSHSGCMTWFGFMERSSVDLPLPLGPIIAPIPNVSGRVGSCLISVTISPSKRKSKNSANFSVYSSWGTFVRSSIVSDEESNNSNCSIVLFAPSFHALASKLVFYTLKKGSIQGRVSTRPCLLGALFLPCPCLQLPSSSLRFSIPDIVQFLGRNDSAMRW